MLRSLLLLLGLLLGIPRAGLALQITFKASAAVDNAAITLADIAEFDDQSELAQALGTQTVASAPAPGQEMLLQTAGIRQHLITTLALPASVSWSGPPALRITRKGASIGPEKIQSIIAEFIEKHKSDLPKAEIRFVPASLPLPFLVPTGELTWEVIPSNPGILASSSMSLIFSVDGHVRKNMAVPGRFEALAQAPVAATSIRKGESVTAEMVRLESRNIAETGTVCPAPEELIGKKANRPIKEGSTIDCAWLDFPPMVARGELVKIILNSGGLHLAATGTANANGMQGQMIRVQNTTSKKIIYGRVTAPGIVEVQL